jgi:hypothetical protein
LPPPPAIPPQGYDFSDDNLESKALPHTGDYAFRQKGWVGRGGGVGVAFICMHASLTAWGQDGKGPSSIPAVASLTPCSEVHMNDPAAIAALQAAAADNDAAAYKKFSALNYK